jgi:(1->4)-alpha-D-glucan 1-alpha-D-glucosylmutase
MAMPETRRFDQLLERTAADLAARRRLPEATYRLQFHAGFTFRAAAGLADYLRSLGVTDCYASPYLKARPGSRHGYDITDHRVLNPEVGSEEDYLAFSRALKDHRLGQVLDVVPNHMGVVGNENPWWNDVLENGPASPYAGFFDIDWHSIKPDLHNKVLLPVLGDAYGKALEAGQIRLRYDNGAFSIHYFDHRFPVAPCTYARVLAHPVGDLERQLGRQSPHFAEYQSILTHIARLPPCDAVEKARVEERQREKEVVKRRLAALTAASAPVRTYIGRAVAEFTGSAGDPHSFDLLDALLNAQPYRLASWRVASDEINYRRFFDINELAALSLEKAEVFSATHELVLRLLREGHVTGLRIDHPDGLYDPRQYLERLQRRYFLDSARRVAESDPEWRGVDWRRAEPALREAVGRFWEGLPKGSPLRRPLYVVVEKILGPHEPLHEDWPTYGTTGYEFLHALNNLFVDADHGPGVTKFYRRWTGRTPPFRELVYQCKRLTLRVSLAGELQMLTTQLDRLSEKDRRTRDFTFNSLRRALREIIASFEVYRSYVAGREVSERDRGYIERATLLAKRRNPAVNVSVFDFVRDTLLLRAHDAAPTAVQAEVERFVGKFQQVTAPVMAKGLEDTAFYQYNRLASLNEVGGDPRQFGAPVEEFHRRLLRRQERTPHGLSATATHDTKRGEDTRARLNALSEMPEAWRKAVARWGAWNKKHRVALDDETAAPDRNTEYFIYQTLIGAWPLTPTPLPPGERGTNVSPLSPGGRGAGGEGEGPDEYAAFVARVQEYLQKAIHEAKVHTSWVNANPKYDEAIRRFTARLLDPAAGGRFLNDFREFQAVVSHYGLFNSLSQALLKVAAPGAPDVYQGTELWDFSLVDPDNRRPVDYDLRRRLLDELDRRAADAGDRRPALARELVEARADGRVKLYLLSRALRCRRDHPGLFSEGEYLPAAAAGAHAESVCGFVRRRGPAQAVAAAPRLLTRVVRPDELPLGPVWGDGALLLPEVAPESRWWNAFTGEILSAKEQDGRAALPLAEVFANFPAALLLPA